MKKNLLLAFCFLCTLSLTYSQTVYYVNASATGANNGTSWTNAFKTIQQALATAFVGEEIWIAKGIYKPDTKIESFQLVSGVTLYGGFNGNETSLTQRDPRNNQTILSGDLDGDDNPTDPTVNRIDNAYHVAFVAMGVMDAGLDGLIIYGGQTEGVTGVNDARRGGGVLAYGSVNINNCIFRANYGYFGGGFYPRGTAARFNLTDCVFSNNSGEVGGAMYVVSPNGGIIDNCRFESNTSIQNGSAINLQQSPVTVSNCSFTDNLLNASFNNVGGALYINESIATIENCQFVGNAVTSNGTSGNRGGAMWINSSNAQINGCTFLGNTATNSGGAIHISGSSATTKFSQCIFDNNSAAFGGAMTNYNNGTTSATFLRVEYDNCTFKDNTAVTSGGAISNGFKTQARVTNSIFEGNTARFGGAVFAQNDSTDLYYADCEFKTNEASASGGAFNSSVGIRSTVLRCLFEANTGMIGGAMQVSEDTVDRSNLNLSQSNFNFNSALMQGGAINLQNADATIVNNIFSNNFIQESTGAGGVMSVNCVNGDNTLVKLINNTFANNEAPTGAGVASFTDENTVVKIQLLNNILFHPNGNSLEIEAGTPEFESLGGNLSYDQSVHLTAPSDQKGKDPQFVDPNLDNFRLKAGSPCINAGVNIAETPKIDFEGRNRDQMPDIGGYEFGGSINTDNPLADRMWSVFTSQNGEHLLVQIEADWTGEFMLQILDGEGKYMQSHKLNKLQNQEVYDINLMNVPKGVYFARLAQASYVGSKAFIN